MTEPIKPEPTPEPEPTPTPTPTPDGPPGSWSEIFKHPRFRELNDRAKAAEEALAKITSDQKKANDEALEKRAEYKTLWENSQTQLETERKLHLRLSVAMGAGLPAELAERLVGDTKEEMQADAATLQGLVKPVPGPGQAPPVKGQPTKAVDFSKMTPAEIRKFTEGKSVDEVLQAAA